ncbi:uncharacterized protein B0H18DRAFT_497856 [Fomitopsis serialis]|uniref:uncharacterized protein n=1 Tax=Fomitopsis serialis TaxID=139415 RepID=UPI002007F19E|nr:uncharacterized protein B0H18DRAFT_497856 [Neoantrodia serialis]KAH9922933.1 hypothetical protein B0H18DRAFT_497856 [Neoantrodia serialis]
MASSLDTIFGSALVGIMIAAMVYGILVSQLFVYFRRFPDDPNWMKALVAGLWAVLSFLLATNIHMIYVYLIKDWGNTQKLAYATWDWLLYVACTSVASTGVQMFFARRIFILSRHWIFRWVTSGIVVILSLIQFVVGFYAMAECYRLKKFLTFSKVTWAVDVWLGCGSACDILIACVMCYLLHTSRTGVKRTNKLINKLMAYAVQTGAITSIVEIICLASFTGDGFHYGHIMVVFPLGGLYATSLLANLLARQSVSTNNGGRNLFELSSGARPSNQAVVESTIKFSPSPFATTTTVIHDDTGKPIDLVSPRQTHNPNLLSSGGRMTSSDQSFGGTTMADYDAV